MRKRWTAALLALFLAAALLPAPARAAAPAGGSAGSRLTGVERDIYNYLREEIGKVAQGARTNTDFRVPDQSGLSWTQQELGASGASASARAKEKLNQTVNVEKIFSCLSADCPFELFWRSDRYTWDYSISQAGGRVSVRNMTIHVQVAQDYRGGSVTSTSTAKIAAANQVLANAQAIVDKYQGLPDFEKLEAYRKEICRLVSYNRDAADHKTAYGNPWQMIWVFDGDPGTNVVCEGYAKAFQYLCGQSRFIGDVVCYTVNGSMGSGGHMWNVVRMGDGKNYLVDVTNCDSGTIGADDKLFLSGASASSDGRTYTVSKGRVNVSYTYDADQKDLYTDGWLSLSGTDYEPGFDLPKPAQPSAIPFTDVGGQDYFTDAVRWAVEEGITNGTSETTFSPNQPCTHAQILTFLWRAAGEPGSDGEAPDGVEQSDYYYDAVRWAAWIGMLEEDFDPAADCSRMDAVWYIWRAFGGPGYMVATGFTDVPDPVDSPYAWAVGWALLEGITTGTSDNTFSPDSVCSRGQIVTFLYRAYH